MVRPHPAVWRLVHGAAVMYVVALVWMLFQTVDEARQALKVRHFLRPGRCWVSWACIARGAHITVTLSTRVQRFLQTS